MELTFEEMTSLLDEMHYQMDGFMTHLQYEWWQSYEYSKEEEQDFFNNNDF